MAIRVTVLCKQAGPARRIGANGRQGFPDSFEDWS